MNTFFSVRQGLAKLALCAALSLAITATTTSVIGLSAGTPVRAPHLVPTITIEEVALAPVVTVALLR